jgi:hypothetical protein
MARNFAEECDVVLVQLGSKFGTDPGSDKPLKSVLLLLFERPRD